MWSRERSSSGSNEFEKPIAEEYATLSSGEHGALIRPVAIPDQPISADAADGDKHNSAT
jgi:hypothetical protein